MTIAFRFNPKHGAVIAKVEGSLSLEDLLQYLNLVATDPKIPSEHMTLFDASEVKKILITPFQLEELASAIRLRYSARAAKRMAVITRSVEVTNLADHYENLAATFGENALVFYNYDVACKWLGIPPDA